MDSSHRPCRAATRSPSLLPWHGSRLHLSPAATDVLGGGVDGSGGGVATLHVLSAPMFSSQLGHSSHAPPTVFLPPSSSSSLPLLLAPMGLPGDVPLIRLISRGLPANPFAFLCNQACPCVLSCEGLQPLDLPPCPMPGATPAPDPAVGPNLVVDLATKFSRPISVSKFSN